LNGEILAVIENNLDKENKDLLKLRTIVTRVLKPRFLYACSSERILFYDNAWRGLEAGEFKQVLFFSCLRSSNPLTLPLDILHRFLISP
jgi:type I restriction enzyme R subunit